MRAGASEIAKSSLARASLGVGRLPGQRSGQLAEVEGGLVVGAAVRAFGQVAAQLGIGVGANGGADLGGARARIVRLAHRDDSSRVARRIERASCNQRPTVPGGAPSAMAAS